MSFSDIQNSGAWTQGGSFTFTWTPESTPVSAHNLYLSGSPTPAHFAYGATLTGGTSHATCRVIWPVEIDSFGYKTYIVDSLTGTFQVGEAVSDGTNSKTGGGGCPFIGTDFMIPPEGIYPAAGYGLLQDGFTYYVYSGYEEQIKWVGGASSLGQILFTTETEVSPTSAGTSINDLVDAGLASVTDITNNGDGTYTYTVTLSASISAGTYYLKAADFTWKVPSGGPS